MASGRRAAGTLGVLVVAVTMTGVRGDARQNTQAAPGPDGALSPAAQNQLVQRYCVTCHDDAKNTGGFSFQHFDAATADPDMISSMVDMLKAGAMPPRGQPRPDAATLFALTNALTVRVAPDGSARAANAPGAPGNANASADRSAEPQSQPEIIAFAHQGDRMPAEAQTAVLRTVCARCHSDDRKPGGVSFEHATIEGVAQDIDLAERAIAKLRAGMMPPANAPRRPDRPSLDAFVASLERRVDEAAALHPNPGGRVAQRLNRAEYARSIRSVLGLDIDVAQWLPPDTISHNFDNIAAVQDFSPTLVQSYLDAAGEISRLAIGDPDATATSVSYTIPQTLSQVAHVDGAPEGTRGGLSIVHAFPADGTYRFKLTLFSTLGGRLFGLTAAGEQIQIAIDDRQVALLDVDPRMSEAVPRGLTMESAPIDITAGPHRLSAAFVVRAEGPVDDLIAPQAQTLADLDIGDAKGLTLLPHLRSVAVEGPFAVSGVSDSPTRRRIFVCRPTQAAEERPCAERIVSHLARAAYRGRPTASELRDLMKFYDQGRDEGGFESGIRMALQAILASPRFLFRVEPAPVAAQAGEDYAIDDRALASRLSYFLWAEPPDRPLLDAANAGRLHDRAVLDREVARMLKDPRSLALATRFAAAWLRLQDVSKVHPDAIRYPTYDGRIERALVRETELFFDSIVREDHSVLDLLTANYTYVNDELAAFYGIPDVAGSAFRRVPLAGTHRRGVLGQGSILVETSVATRTNPVLRGKWILEVLLGQPPPPPPPNIPLLEATGAVSASGRPLSVRQRMESHRSNAFCASCHRVIDPLGLALEHFDPAGRWRALDNDVPVDASTTLYDGTPMDGLDGLVDALLKRRETFLRVFASNLMAYAIGRDVQAFDMPAVRAIVRQAGAHDNRFSLFVLGVVHSDAFQKGRVAVETTVESQKSEVRSQKLEVGSRK